MSDKEQVNNQRELNKSKKEQINIDQKIQNVNQRSLDISYSLVESLKETLGIQSKYSQNEKDILRVNKDVNKAILERSKSFSSIADLNKEIAKSTKALEKSTKLNQGLESSIQKDREEGANFVIDIAKGIESQNEELQKYYRKLEEGQAVDQQIISDLEAKIASEEELLTLGIDQLNTLEKQYVFGKLNNEELAKQVKQQNELKNSLGASGKLAELLGKIPGVGGIAQDALSDVTKELSEMQLRGEKLPGPFKTMRMLLGGIGKGIVDFLTDPLAIAGAAATQLITAFTKIDKLTSDFAKNLNMSESSAFKTVGEIKLLAAATDDVFVGTKALSESLVAVNQTLGTNVMLNKEDLVTFTKLREVAGLTNEELMGIQSISLANGKSLKENTGEFLAQAKITAASQGVALNEKELLKEISSISAAITVSFGGSAKELAKAAATAKSLGLELDQVDAIAGSLLNFEESISNELEAELLLGKSINLEKARQAALDNDLATVAKEIADQVGSSADFAKMNRIQQEALAKSVGMTREDLASTLFTQEQLAGVTGEEAEKRQASIDALIKEKGLAEAQRIIAEDGVENLESQASASEKLQATLDKALEAFAGIAAIVYPFVSSLAEGVSLITEIADYAAIAAGSFFLIQSYQKQGLVYQLAQNAQTALGNALLATQQGIETFILNVKKKGFFTSLAETALSAGESVMTALGKLGPAGLLAPILGAAAMTAIYAIGKSFLKADDLISQGGMAGYGSRTLMAPEGAIALNNNDTVIAGTNLGGGSGNKETNALLKTLVTQNAKKPQISPVGLYEVQ